jgi:hypothetical protein
VRVSPGAGSVGPVQRLYAATFVPLQRCCAIADQREREREQKRNPRGSPNGSKEDRHNDREWRNHQDKIDEESEKLREITRRLDEIERQQQ